MNEMKNAARIIALHGGLDALRCRPIHIDMAGFDRLCIEHVGPAPTPGLALVSVAYDFEQQGDLMADPEMTFEVNPADNQIVWDYTGEPPEQFFSGHISGAERQANGNVLICEGTSGRIFEVTQRREVVWEWISPFMNPNQGILRPWIFRAQRYPPDLPGLSGRELDPAGSAGLNRLHGL